MSVRRFRHDHEPVFRVVRRGWDDPVDASFSRRREDRRWNTSSFASLYCCCSEGVARAVTRDLLGVAAVDAEDLQPAYRPQLTEIGWSGEVVDVVSPDGVAAAGFPADYPARVDKAATRAAAEGWYGDGAEGVCCRSASLHRLGRTHWTGDHRGFGEVAVYLDNARRQPSLDRRRDDLEWLRASFAAEE
jgi:hypothetical protein